MTLYEMMRTGRIDKAIGGIDHIEMIERDNGDMQIDMNFAPTSSE
jgi:hypothetical protein